MLFFPSNNNTNDETIQGVGQVQAVAKNWYSFFPLVLLVRKNARIKEMYLEGHSFLHYAFILTA